MAKKKTFEISNSLAKALGETVNAAKNHSGELNIDVVTLKKIDLDPDNPRDLVLSFSDLYNGLSKDDIQYARKVKEKESLSSMVNSIRDQGVLNPIIVYKLGDKYRLVTGERRTLSSILCGKETIQARVLDGKPSQLKLGLLQWIENIERKDLTLWERLKNLDKVIFSLAKERNQSVNDISSAEISQTLGFSIQLAANYKSVLFSSGKLKELVERNQIKNLEKAALISRAPAEKQEELISACLNGSSLKELKSLLDKNQKLAYTEKKQKSLGRGRQATNVNFGTTKNIQLAKIIITSILDNNRFHHLEKSISNIDWDDFSAVTVAFRTILKEIESIEVESKC